MPNPDKSYWLQLCPDLSIEGQGGAAEGGLFNEEMLDLAADAIRDPGYLNIPSVIPEALISPVREGMTRLKAENIPPVFIYLYDQPWHLFERLRPLIAKILGENYKTLPNFWAWHLSERGELGWPPHKDCSAETVFDIGGDQIFMSLSLWVPLNDVGPENGCMLVVPRGKEAHLPEDGYYTRDGLNEIAVPLPAKAGSVLGWPQDLVHWGGEYRDLNLPPRLSLSFEFQSLAFDPLATPLLETSSPPHFSDRFKLLTDQFEKYRHIA